MAVITSPLHGFQFKIILKTNFQPLDDNIVQSQFIKNITALRVYPEGKIATKRLMDQDQKR